MNPLPTPLCDLLNNPAGLGGGRLTAVRPALAIFESLVAEIIATLERLAALVRV